MNNIFKLLLCAALPVMQSACHQRPKPRPQPEETFYTGKAEFGVDESFQPIIDEEAFVFKGLHTDARPVITYQPENSVLRRLLNDSVRFAILSRDLRPDERKVLTDRGFAPNVNLFAHDAVVLIVNQSSTDTAMTVNQIKQMLNGKAYSNKSIVFDNPNSSIVRYLKELSGNEPMNLKNIYALKTNKDVIRYVSEHPQAIGIVGFSWLDEPDDDYAAAAAKVKIVGVRDEGNKKFAAQYFKPSQTTLALKQYPLSRGIYTVNSTGKMGLGAGFENFVLSERGQRIILKSGLLPDSIPQRQISIRKELNN